MTARSAALDTLVRVEAGAWSNLVLPGVLRTAGLSARDRAFATELVYGTLRQQRRCDHLVSLTSSRRIGDLDAAVRAALRLGTYQLLTDVPPHAAVGATVDAVGARAPRARGFVNAVLRKVTELGPDWPWPAGDDTAAVAVRVSQPDWIVEQLIADLGRADALAMLDALNRPPSVTLRADRVARDVLVDELRAAGATAKPGALAPRSVVARGIGDPAALPALREGRATPQDEASQVVVDLVGAEPGDRVLDVAAAPGGKATGLALAVGPDGLVVASDVHPARTSRVRDAVARLRLSNVAVVVADGRSLPLRTTFTRVLVDAPCTGLGVLHRRADARWRVKPDDVDALASRQRQLFAAAAAVVAPGGTLVYSACTVTRAETLDIDAWAGREFPGFAPVAPPGAPWRPWGRGAMLLPQDAGTDGMFVLVLQRAR
jgi:16S rRNA (cytosine967-C5)-methyltransferase